MELFLGGNRMHYMDIPSELSIERRILLIRGQKVMLDAHLAHLYGVPGFRLRQAVQRNKGRFPPDFMLPLTEREVAVLVSQNVIPSRKYLGGHLPYAFTREGVAMLSSVLRSERAVQVNIAIMRAFVRLRDMLAKHSDLARKLDKLERKYDVRFRAVFDELRAMREFQPPVEPLPAKPAIGFIREEDK